jgi:hypothetical protein
MEKIKIGALLLLIGLLAVACEDGLLASGEDGEIGPHITAKFLQGEWNWVITNGVGIAGPYTQTPAGSDHSETLKFSANNHVEITIINGGVETSEIYSFALSREEGKVLISYLLNGSLARKQFIERDHDKIIFSNYEPCCDNTYNAFYEK